MTFPISMIPYTNMAPFQAMGPPAGCHFVYCTPKDSISALRSGQVWAAAVPVGGLPILEDCVDMLGAFGIAARKTVMSVMFFSNRPWDEFKSPCTLRLTAESASSIRLLYLLLGYRHGFDAMPQPVVDGQSADGELHIGDRALVWAYRMQHQGQVQAYKHVTDLAARWFAHHGLPFVFARWVVRRDAPVELCAVLMRWLMDFQGREPELIRQSAPDVATRLGLPLSYAQHYLSTIRRCLSAEDEAGQERFLNELNNTAPPVSWTGPGRPSHLLALGH